MKRDAHDEGSKIEHRAENREGGQQRRSLGWRGGEGGGDGGDGGDGGVNMQMHCLDEEHEPVLRH